MAIVIVVEYLQIRYIWLLCQSEIKETYAKNEFRKFARITVGKKLFINTLKFFKLQFARRTISHKIFIPFSQLFSGNCKFIIPEMGRGD